GRNVRAAIAPAACGAIAAAVRGAEPAAAVIRVVEVPQAAWSDPAAAARAAGVAGGDDCGPAPAFALVGGPVAAGSRTCLPMGEAHACASHRLHRQRDCARGRRTP